MTTTPGGLAARLKQATRDLHIQTERSAVMVDLLKGRLRLEVYCTLLRNLHPIYAVLEQGLDRKADDARVQCLWQPALRRLQGLEQDLDRLHGPAWRCELPLTATAGVYVERLQRLAEAMPEALLAHAYVRYLGDLHGGQALARLVRQNFALSKPGAGGGPAVGSGVAFYDFGSPERVAGLQAEFRSGLDRLAALLPVGAQDALVAEACLGFDAHRTMFDELQALSAGVPN